MRNSRKCILLSAIGFVLAGVCVAQFRPGGPDGPGPNGGGGPRRGFGRGGGYDNGPIVQTEGGITVNEDTVQTARETASHSTGTPEWTNSPGFDHDVFTFARIIYKMKPSSRGYRASWMGWINDYPDSDLNLSYRLQQLTSMRTNPDGRVLKLTNSAMFDYPFIYMVKAGRAEFKEEEVPILRRYLLAGGVLMADDFWGESEWDSFEKEMKRVIPERNWTELPMSHPLFHCVFDLKMTKNELQCPPIHFFERTGSTSRNGEDSKDVHVRAWLDDKDRIMVIATHNTDNGDGWEREGEDSSYFEMISEKRAYPLGINVVFYVMTH